MGSPEEGVERVGRQVTKQDLGDIFLLEPPDWDQNLMHVGSVYASTTSVSSEASKLHSKAH